MSLLFAKIHEESPFDKVWVWKIDEEADLSVMEDMSFIYPAEISKFSNVKRKTQWAVSRKIVFANFGGKKITQEKNGYPLIEGEKVFLSISHCKDLLVVKTSNLPCGIDIEEISERVIKIKDKFLNDIEKAKFEKNNEDLLIAWTVKESIYKMLNIPGIEFKSQFLVEHIDHQTGIVKAFYNLNVDKPIFVAVKLKFEKIENYIFTQTL